MLFAQQTLVSEKYEIVAPLGTGGMGSVYKARHRDMDRFVALKFLHVGSGDPEGIERFRREAQILSTLKSKNIVACYELSSWDGRPYVAMEYVEGESLLTVLGREKRLPHARAVDIARQAAEALACAHSNGVVHRDIKPSNILLVGDTAKIIDFGLAKLANPEGLSAMKLTETGIALGSVMYMSPEQCVGRNVDERADIYGLGIVLYQMLTGDPPFRDEESVAIMHRHLTDVPPPISEAASDVEFPVGLDVVVARALAKSLNDRYSTMAEFQRALHLVSTGQGLSVTQYVPPVPSSPFPLKAKTNRKFFKLLAVAAGVLISAGLIAIAVNTASQPSALETGRKLASHGEFEDSERYLLAAENQIANASPPMPDVMEELSLNIGIARWRKENQPAALFYFCNAAKHGGDNHNGEPVLANVLATYATRFPKLSSIAQILHALKTGGQPMVNNQLPEGSPRWCAREAQLIEFVLADVMTQSAETDRGILILSELPAVPIVSLKLADAQVLGDAPRLAEPNYRKAMLSADASVRFRARLGVARARGALGRHVTPAELPPEWELHLLSDPNVEASYYAIKAAVTNGVPIIATPPAGAASEKGAALAEKAVYLTPEAAYDLAHCLVFVAPDHVIDPHSKHVTGIADWFEFWREIAEPKAKQS